jgi:hypothetical protein
MPNTLESLAHWLASAIPPTGTFGPDETEALLNTLGWSAPPVAVDFGLDTLDAGPLLRKLAQLDLQLSVGATESPLTIQLQGELLSELISFFNRANAFANGLNAQLAAGHRQLVRSG